MIYILTGIAKSGKSLVANRLIQKYSLPTFSTDYIMMMLVRGNKTLGIDPDGEDEIVANQLRPYINGLIQTMVENKVPPITPERSCKSLFSSLLKEVRDGISGISQSKSMPCLL